MKRKESKYAIECDPEYGPIFRNGNGSDIYIVTIVMKRIAALLVMVVKEDMNVILNIRNHYL